MPGKSGIWKGENKLWGWIEPFFLGFGRKKHMSNELVTQTQYSEYLIFNVVKQKNDLIH